jgi:hypothetical protein
MNDEFYIGWQEKAPAQTGRAVRRVVAAALVFALVTALVAAWSQRTIGRAVFEWGQVKGFSGVLRAKPVPHLLVADTNSNSFKTHYLVNPWKFGFDAALAKKFDGQRVTLRGTRIYRDDQMMIEVERGSVARSTEATSEPLRVADSRSEAVSLGQQTFIGEIVDSKCFLGVMNPGQLKPHRACATRCISGGVPPVLLVRQADGTARYLLLLAPDGQPVNQRILDLVAEPVEITGEVERQGELLVLRADPATYRRL